MPAWCAAGASATTAGGRTRPGTTRTPAARRRVRLLLPHEPLPGFLRVGERGLRLDPGGGGLLGRLFRRRLRVRGSRGLESRDLAEVVLRLVGAAAYLVGGPCIRHRGPPFFFFLLPSLIPIGRN